MSRYSIFFFVFFSQLIITSPYTLVGRSGHTASYMDNKIYFLGGRTKIYRDGTNDFFCLDVSKPFNLDSTLPIVVDLSNDARQIYPHKNGASAICGPNKDTIYLICRASMSYSYRFINNKEWVPGTIFIPEWSSTVCNKNGSYIYTYGSYHYDVKKHAMYTMSITDTTSWNSGLSDLDITNNLGLSILLPDERIAYIGYSGERIDDFVDFNFRNTYIYDTNYGTWENMSTSGIEPSPRISYTAVLTQDGLIIIYGGANFMTPVPDQILVLDTKVDHFNWSTPNINPAPSSAPFRGHTATLVGNYMIIAFGMNDHITVVLLMMMFLVIKFIMIDVNEKNNYKWVKSFTPTLATTPNITKTAYPTKSAIIGGTTGGIATIIIIMSNVR
uniref:Galactose oxidase n=1 Tax=Rhizophagus irregularis (strain DAOM 181602 / DAOM 197198 / MUCL 43194) TaxID=747089 RepID=U9SZN8_RHIID